MTTATAGQWVDANGLAAHLGYDVKRIHALTGPSVQDAHRIPFHRLTPNGAKRFYLPEVDEWLLARAA